MNILVLAESLDSRNGWGAYAAGLVSALRAHGERVTVLAAHGESEGPRLPGVHANWIIWRIVEWRLKGWMRRRSFHVVHVTAEVYAQLFPAFGRIPFLVTIHGTYADPQAYGPYAKRMQEGYRRAGGIVAVSSQTRARVPSAFREKTFVIPNGVDPAITSEPFESAPFAIGSPLVLSVGAIKPRKGFDRLIAGFAEFQRAHPGAVLALVGRADRPDVREALVRQAHGLGLEGRVRFVGEVSRPVLLGWYRACDVFALTPVEHGGSEGFGLVYLEANAFGKPCVGSRGSAAEEAILEGEAGFLADPDNAASVAQALTRALTLPFAQIHRHAETATWQSRVSTYLQRYREVSESTPATP